MRIMTDGARSVWLILQLNMDRLMVSAAIIFSLSLAGFLAKVLQTI